MASITNCITLIGNVGQDPNFRTFPETGTKLVEISLATNETYTNKEGQRVTTTEWHRLKAFGKPAEVLAQYVRKGSQLAVTGSVRYNKWTDKHEQRRTTAEIIVNDFTFLGGRRDDRGASYPGEVAAAADAAAAAIV